MNVPRPIKHAGLVAVLILAGALPSGALGTGTLSQVAFEQHLNAQVSLETAFRDEQGNAVKLADYFGHKPVILTLGYHECPMLCSLVLNGLVESLRNMRFDAGKQFAVVTASIDPGETPTLAAEKKRHYLQRYGRAGAADGWHFLTGEEASIRRLAEEVGFRYAYDAASGEYAHPSGLVVLTPEGRVARYFFGVQYPAKELRQVLEQAAAHQVGSPIRQLLLLCFHYDPATGRYGLLVGRSLRVGAVLTLLALGAGVGMMLRRERQHKSPGAVP